MWTTMGKSQKSGPPSAMIVARGPLLATGSAPSIVQQPGRPSVRQEGDLTMMTAEERERRRLQRSAARKNAKIEADVPLYAEFLPKHTEKSEYWNWRYNKAGAAENVALLTTTLLGPLLQFDWWTLRNLGRQHLPEAVWRQLDEYICRTYPSVSYWVEAWKGILTGRRRLPCKLRLEFKPEWVNQWNSDGRRLFEEYQPPEDWTPPFTVDQLAAIIEVAPIAEPDDEGLITKLDAIFFRAPLAR
jgi:hypothetical protein